MVTLRPLSALCVRRTVVACRNDWDNVPVVRVALCLKPESSIDYHLKKQLGLGVGLSEILADLNCDFRCSVNIVGAHPTCSAVCLAQAIADS